MPPPGSFGKDFLKRIKERTQSRVQRELSPTPTNVPNIGGVPLETVPKGLGQRIKEKVRQTISDSAPVANRFLDPRRALDPETVRYRIRYAGGSLLLLFMNYNNEWRFVEPYSYRVSPKTKKLLFFGFCRLHNSIHAFYPEKIQGLIVTDQSYRPRWTVELD